MDFTMLEALMAANKDVLVRLKNCNEKSYKKLDTSIKRCYNQSIKRGALTMGKLESIRLNGRIGTWYEIDRNDQYILFESEQFGDEADWIMTDLQLNEIAETRNGIDETARYL